jgi:hypothetical protein
LFLAVVPNLLVFHPYSNRNDDKSIEQAFEMSTTLVVQSSVPKLEGKKNYKTWELRIRPLLDSKDEWTAVDYSPV